MNKFKKMNTNIVVVISIVFLTVFLSTGGALASTLATGDIKYFLVGLMGWATQFLVSSLVVLIVLAIVKLLMLLFNLKESKKTR